MAEKGNTRPVSGPWASNELGGAELGDHRLASRLVKLAEALASQPDASLPSACETWAATKGAYRFFSNPSVDPAEIVAAHRSATLERIRGLEWLLVVQDTTYFNFTSHPATKGLGHIADPGSLGFCMHTSLALSQEGVPLGILSQEVWSRQAGVAASGDRIGRRPVAGKESERWLRALETSTEGLPVGTRVLTIADREADIYEFLVLAQRLGQDILVRAAYNRRLTEEATYLWDALESSAVLDFHEVEVSRGDGAARQARLELRATKVTLKPRKYKNLKLPPVTLSAVLAREVAPPANQEGICWLLLTTLPVSGTEEVKRCLYLYTQRWKIERYHYTLKSGCRIEELQLEAMERLHRALAVYSIVAWRLLSMTYANRVTPQRSCAEFLTTAEWKTLHCKMNRTTIPPDTPPDLRTAVLWIAQLGGFLGRRHDGAPGVKVLWRGLRRLQDMAEIWELMQTGG